MLAGPDLIATLNEVDFRHGERKIRTVSAQQLSLDLQDRWTHRSAEGDATLIVEIEGHLAPSRRDDSSPDGLQRVAARQDGHHCKTESEVSETQSDLPAVGALSSE
jgi:hypothetical protein